MVRWPHGAGAYFAHSPISKGNSKKGNQPATHQAISVLDDVAEAVPTAELRPETQAPDGHHEAR
jgi:hypothetical protein